MAKTKEESGPRSPRILNRKARHDFHILEVVECGMDLVGTEVKSLRAGQAKIDEAHARIQNGEVFLIGANIAQYPQAAAGMQHEATRDRKLLLHGRQIDQLISHVKQKGKTLVPLAVYFKRGWAKCELGIVEGKRFYDKREAIKKKFSPKFDSVATADLRVSFGGSQLRASTAVAELLASGAGRDEDNALEVTVAECGCRALEARHSCCTRPRLTRPTHTCPTSPPLLVDACGAAVT